MKTFITNPKCPSESQIQGAGFRISVLTESLLRLEYEKDGHFTDNATQTVLNRDFKPVSFKITEDSENTLRFETAKLSVRYDKAPFSAMGLEISLKDTKEVWKYGDNGFNLLGTVRTLDETNGVIQYGKGLFSRQGYAFFDDGASCELVGEPEDGEKNRSTVIDRVHPEEDIYFWGYGKDFKGALKDFYHLTGKTPMIPRYALGNWWSKYEKYTEKSYLELMDRFEAENIPITVAVIDMDWHLVDIDPKYGSGWTGYTWNTDFFPDYKRFLKELHKRGKAVTLNLHPADGIRAFESMYEPVAKRMGIDPKSGKTVDFDLMDPDFTDAYFEEVMQPYEDDGVDFWWIDWQQGTKAKQGSVDPLWILNHYHYLDQLGRGKRAMIFSRYAGLGSHRYPIGFSGDTYATWESLQAQPFFTSNASNVGYGWWSHDIGGHMHGEEDCERTCRWIQYGVFSPIMRLHSSCNPFFFKEPWNLPQPMRQIAGDFMRLRHAMIPYLYTGVYEAYKDDLPLIRPLYYESPKEEGAYHSRNGYYFGTELVAYAITSKIDEELQMSETWAFIPEGRWIDIFNGNVYEGPMSRKLYRPLEEIPVLLKAGGILPLDAGKGNSDVNSNPSDLTILLGVGAEGSYTLYEDDGISNSYLEGGGAFTEITQHYDSTSGKLTIEVKAAKGDVSLIPKTRNISFVLCGVDSIGDNEETQICEDKRQIQLKTICVKTDEGAKLVVEGVKPGSGRRENKLFELLKRSHISYDLKDRIYNDFRTGKISTAEDIMALDISEKLKNALTELS